MLSTTVIDLCRSCAKKGTDGRLFATGWGASQPLRTLQASCEQHESVIEWDTLPRTFQDAITTARYLGIDYLWVDSLCIIQDSTVDWLKESALMAQIYQNSVLTISATKASTGFEGCFSSVKSCFLGHQIIVEHEGKTEPTPCYVRRQLEHFEDPLCANEDFEKEKDFPVLTRAWVYQERVLSPRTLHFCRGELEWECRRLSHCQCSRRDYYRAAAPVSFGKKWYHKRGLGALRDFWTEKVVSDYTRKDITYESDFLPAISGVANQMQRSGAGRYLAGLWEDTLLTDLFWMSSVAVGTTPNRRPEKWRAPTWSVCITPSKLSPIARTLFAEHCGKLVNSHKVGICRW